MNADGDPVESYVVNPVVSPELNVPKGENMSNMRDIEIAVQVAPPKVTARNVDVYYATTHAIKNVSVDILDKRTVYS